MSVTCLYLRMPLRQQPKKRMLIEFDRNIVPVADELRCYAGVHLASENVQILRLIALVQLHWIMRRLIRNVLEEDFKLLTTLRQERYRTDQCLLRGDDLFPVRIASLQTFRIPDPVFRFDAAPLPGSVRPRAEHTGFRGLGLHQSQRKRYREVIHIQRDVDVQQLLAVGRSDPLTAEIDPLQDLARIVPVHKRRCRSKQSDKVLRKLADRAVFTFIGNPPLHTGLRKQSSFPDSQSSFVVFDLQYFVPVSANRIPELIESHDTAKLDFSSVCRSERHLFRRRTGAETDLAVLAFNKQGFMLRNGRHPADQFPERDQRSFQFIFVHFNLHTLPP